jgi:hypothetical protein
VQTDEALGRTGRVAERLDRKRGRGRAEQRIRPHDPAQLAPQLRLGLQVLDHGLDDGAAGRKRRQVGLDPDARGVDVGARPAARDRHRRPRTVARGLAAGPEDDLAMLRRARREAAGDRPAADDAELLVERDGLVGDDVPGVERRHQ